MVDAGGQFQVQCLMLWLPPTWEVTQWVTTSLRDDPGDEVLGNPSGPQVHAPTHHGLMGPMSVDNHPLPTTAQVLFAFMTEVPYLPLCIFLSELLVHVLCPFL